MPPEAEDLIIADEGAGEAPISIRDSLADAFDAFEAGDGDGAALTPAAQDAATAEAEAQRVRDQQGRFAKPGETAQKTTETVTPKPGAGTATAAIQPPATWSATAKAKFNTLDPVIQQEVLKREGDMDQGRAQWQQGAERLKRLDALLAPRQERLQMAGVDEATFVGQLLAANDYLDTNPIDAMLALGRQKGVNWQALFGRLQGQPAQQQQPQLPPQLAHLGQQVQNLTNWASQQQAAVQQSQMQGHLSTVEQFATDPANVYFENVKDRMSQLIRSGAAKDLSDAYQQACWADAEIRPLMLQTEEQKRLATTAGRQRAKAAEARHASGSLTGSPSPGASPGGVGAKPATVRAALSDAWDAFA